MSSFISGLENGGWPLGAAHSPSASGSARGPKQCAPKHRSISLAFDAVPGRGSPGSGLQADEVRGNPNPAANGGSIAVPPKCRRKAGGLHRLQNDVPVPTSALECRGGLQPLEWPGQGLRDNGRICARQYGAHAECVVGGRRGGARKNARSLYGLAVPPLRPEVGRAGTSEGELCPEFEKLPYDAEIRQAQQPHWIGTKFGDRSSNDRREAAAPQLGK